MKLNYIQQLIHLWELNPVFRYLHIKYFKNRAFLIHFLLKKFSQYSILFQFLAMKNYFENQNFEMFEEAVYNFGKSDGDIIW